MARAKAKSAKPRARRAAALAPERGVEPVLDGIDASLLDIVDHVLTKGIVITGDLVLGVADIDLVYLRVSAVLCAADRVLGPSAKAKRRRHPGGHTLARQRSFVRAETRGRGR